MTKKVNDSDGANSSEQQKEQIKHQKILATNLREVSNKVEASLQETIRKHVSVSANKDDLVEDDFDAKKHGLDYLDCKNTLLLSYLIDLTCYLKRQIMLRNPNRSINRTSNRSSSDEPRDDLVFNRLIEMRTVIDKVRGLDKKLRYQIDKLLAQAASLSNNSSFAIDTSTGVDDPLHFRPNIEALDFNIDDDTKIGNDNDIGHDDIDDDASIDDDENDKTNGDDVDDDDDLAAARKTLEIMATKEKKSGSKKSKMKDNFTKDSDDNDVDGGDPDDGIYRAPRVQAVPYLDEETHGEKVEKRDKRRQKSLRASEIAQTMRLQYGDTPEVDDIHGGVHHHSTTGSASTTARRISEKMIEKTKFEEDNMIRLTTTRIEKKERKKLQRDAMSNLNAISDLANLVVRDFEHDRRDNRKHTADINNGSQQQMTATSRHGNGKRKREHLDHNGRVIDENKHEQRKYKSFSKNSLQSTLYGTNESSNKKKSKK